MSPGANTRRLHKFINKYRVPVNKTTLKPYKEGSYGIIYNTGNGRLVKFSKTNGYNLNASKREYNITRRVGELLPNYVPKIYGNFYGNNKSSLFIMEKLNAMPLGEYLKTKTKKEQTKVLEKVNNRIHSLSAVVNHGNLHENNVLVTTNGTIKIINFGESKLLSNHTMKRQTSSVSRRTSSSLRRVLQNIGKFIKNKNTLHSENKNLFTTLFKVRPPHSVNNEKLLKNIRLKERSNKSTRVSESLKSRIHKLIKS
jgi:RIO-like serine/threonine protein kinase